MPLGRRPLLVLLVLPVLALAAGLLTLGAHAQPAPRHAPRVDATASAAAGCTQRTLKYVITDDPRVVQRQTMFENTNNVVTEPGFYTAPQPYTPTLHAASHGYVVVFFRPGLSAAALRPLHALAAAALATRAPVVVAPRPGQHDALVALGLGSQFACASAPTAAQATQVRAFAAGVYPSVKP
jgi:hypothetical protein